MPPPPSTAGGALRSVEDDLNPNQNRELQLGAEAMEFARVRTDTSFSVT